MNTRNPGIKATDFDSVLAAIKANDGLVEDDHRAGQKEAVDRLRKPYAIARFGNHTVFLLSEEQTTYFCLNRMYVDEDGVAHLCSTSVGGVIELKTYRTLEAAIAAYNDPANWMDGWKMTPITDVTYL